MKAVRYDGFGGIDVLRVDEVERPVPGDGQVLVRVKAAGINISEAVLVLVEAGDLTRKPENVSWEVAGGLFVSGTTAWGAVRAVRPEEGETVVISGAAGGSARSPSSSHAVPDL